MLLLPIDPINRVTGSSYLVVDERSDTRILVDCGAYQDGPDPERANSEPFPFDAHLLTWVLLTHGHFDHCGRLPQLVQAGFRGQVLATQATIELAKTVLSDAARISGDRAQVKLVEKIRFRALDDGMFRRPRPLATDLFLFAYRAAHIVGAVSMEIVSGAPEERHRQRSILFSGDIGNNFKGRGVTPFLRHIMHASKTSDVVVMESTYGARTRPPEEVDPGLRRQRLKEVVTEGLARGGPVILPVFSVQRAQDVLYDLHILMAEDPGFLSGTPVLLDGPMAQRVNAVLAHALELDHASSGGKVRPVWLGKETMLELGLDPSSPEDLERARLLLGALLAKRDWYVPGAVILAHAIGRVLRHGVVPGKHPGPEDDQVDPDVAVWERFRVQWNPVDRKTRDEVVEGAAGCVVLATGGMCDGGPVQAWLARHLTNPAASVFTTGYASPSSVAGRLMALQELLPGEVAKSNDCLRLKEVDVPCRDVRAVVGRLSGYSAHADQDGLVRWAFPPNKDGSLRAAGRTVLLTHGDPVARRALAQCLEARRDELGVEMNVVLPAPGGEALDVRTGEWVPRERVLSAVGGAQAHTSEAGDVAKLREEIARLQAQLAERPT